MLCPVHNQEFVLRPAGVSKKTGRPYSAFHACPTFGCSQRPPAVRIAAPSPSYAHTKPDRNWDREAYEKCCSIWAAQELAVQGDTLKANLHITEGNYWALFQSIRADGEKRFATGMDKARQIFSKPVEEVSYPTGDDAPWPTEEPGV